MHLRKQIFWTPVSGVFKTRCFSLWYACNLFLENFGIGGLALGVYEKCPPYNFLEKNTICWVSHWGPVYCLPGWTFIFKQTASGVSSGLLWIFWVLVKWALDTWEGLQWFSPWETRCPPSWSFLLSPLYLALVGLFPCGLWQWLADEEANCLNRDCRLHDSWQVQINFRGKVEELEIECPKNIWFCELLLKITFKPVSMKRWRL